MTKSAYFVTLQTRDSFETTEYAEVAGKLCNALSATLGDTSKLCSIVHSTEIEEPRVEVEIMQSEPAATAPVVARCVVQAESSAKLAFDKNLFSSMVCAELPFTVKITKRAVSKDELLVLADEPPAEEAA